MDFTSLIVVAFLGVVAWLVLRMIRHGGYKGAMYGASVGRCLGEVTGRARGSARVIVRVHDLESTPARASGIELVGKTRTSTTRLYASLSASQKARLTDALREAGASKRGAVP